MRQDVHVRRGPRPGLGSSEALVSEPELLVCLYFLKSYYLGNDFNRDDVTPHRIGVWYGHQTSARHTLTLKLAQ